MPGVALDQLDYFSDFHGHSNSLVLLFPLIYLQFMKQHIVSEKKACTIFFFYQFCLIYSNALQS